MSAYQNWHIPVTNLDITLQSALDSVNAVRAEAEDSLLMIKLAENPRLKQSGLEVYKGEIDLFHHDCIHILLGRGLLDLDGAFTAGFTFGSSKKVTSSEQGVYAFVARHITPDIHAFADDELAIFKEAIRLSYISGCSPLDQFDFQDWLDQPVVTVRDAVGVEDELLLAYYAVEQRRYPRRSASQRLLPAAQKVVAF